MFFEARSEGRAGRLAVAMNILKRMELNWRGAYTVCEVVHSPKQYSYLWDGYQHVVLKQELATYNRVYKEAEAILLLQLSGNLPVYKIGDCTGGATHYHRYDVRPSWSRKMNKVCGRIGKHIFYNGK